MFLCCSISSLFPYTTLFRSVFRLHRRGIVRRQRCQPRPGGGVDDLERHAARMAMTGESFPVFFRSSHAERKARSRRSEEHTSELQSHVNLVCRLPLATKQAT